MQKKIVIQISNYFTKDSWERSLSKHLPNYKKDYKISYVSTKNEVKELSVESVACFCFEFIEDLNYSNSRLRLLYLGISDVDYFDKYNFLDNVILYSSKGIAGKLIAEYTLMISLTLIRNFQFSVINKIKKKWDQKPFLNYGIDSIQNYKIGVLGLGNNGRAIVEIFKSVGCWVAGYSNNENENENLDSWFSEDRLNEILEICDIIIVTIPLRTETRYMIGLAQFQIMGSDSYIINVSRGDLLIEDDLIISLKKQMIKGAAIDVCSMEPLPKRSNLWKIPNLLISPHIAGNINFLVEEIQKDFIDKMKKTL